MNLFLKEHKFIPHLPEYPVATGMNRFVNPSRHRSNTPLEGAGFIHAPKSGAGFILIIIFLALITRLFFLGNSLWHNDAVDFANSSIHLAATHNYLPAHSPDYPAWNVALAGVQKLAYLITGEFSPIILPNLLTAILGILTIIILFYLAKNLTGQNKLVAFCSSLILIFHPSFWFFNEIALSDTVAVFFIILCLFLLDKYLKSEKIQVLMISSFALTLAILTRVPNVFFILIFGFLYFIYHQRTKTKVTLNKFFLIFSLLILLPLVINFLIYGIIHNWNLLEFLSTSRRVSPSLFDLGNTAINFWLYSLPLFVLFYFGGLISVILKKQWYLFTILFSPLLIYFYYYAGWWQKGSFDIDRYLLILAPFVAMGAAIGFFGLINYSKKISKKIKFFVLIFALIIVTAHFFFILLNLFNFENCQKLKPSKIFKTIYPSTYCQINNYHNNEDSKLVLYQTVDRILPKEATIVVGPDEWIYPQFFGNNHGLGQRIFFKLKRDDQESLNYLKTLLGQTSPVFIPHTSLTSNLLELIEQENWQLEVLQPSTKIMILRISKQ